MNSLINENAIYSELNMTKSCLHRCKYITENNIVSCLTQEHLHLCMKKNILQYILTVILLNQCLKYVGCLVSVVLRMFHNHFAAPLWDVL